jgi:hypothetical protein
MDVLRPAKLCGLSNDQRLVFGGLEHFSDGLALWRSLVGGIA